MMKKIVFITSDVHDPHTIKRIEEFKAHGFRIKVYGFRRGEEVTPDDIILLGNIEDLHYSKRLPTLFKGIRKALKEQANSDNILYYFGLDIASVGTMIDGHHKYIYEECDLSHTYIRNALIRGFFDKADKYIIKKSLLTILTSEGFAKYHFGDEMPGNVRIITNRLDAAVMQCAPSRKKDLNIEHLSIGFVGGVRFKSIYSFAEYFIKTYPQHDFHFFGRIAAGYIDKYKSLEQYSNCHFHGAFTSPIDLPAIYSQLDMVLSTYDVDIANVRYAEPNKLYESIFFETPIIVSKGTFLADRVKRLGSGYSVDPLSGDSINKFVNGLSKEDVQSKIENIRKLPKQMAINTNDEFFESLRTILNE